MMSDSPPRWSLFRLQMRTPAAWTVSLLLAAGIAVAPSYMGVACVPLLLLALPHLVARKRMSFEAGLPISAAAGAQARVMAALSVALPPILIAVFASVRQLNDAPSVLTTVAASAAVVVLIAIMYGVPSRDELSAHPHTRAQRAAVPARPVSNDDSIRPTRLWWLSLRSAITLPVGCMVLLGYFAGYSGLDWNWIVYLALFAMLASIMARQRLAWRSALPIALARTMHLVFAPGLVLSALTFAAESTRVHYADTFRRSLTQDAPVFKDDDTFDRRTKVSVRYWQPLSPDAPRLIMAPWGETIAADTLRLLGVTLHNPFSADSTSSAAFVNWQFRRASLAIYGEEFSLDEYKAIDYTVWPVPIVQRLPFHLIRAGLALSLVIGVLLIVEILRSLRKPQTPKFRRTVAGAFILIVVVPTLLNIVFRITRGTKILGESLDALLLRMFAAFPDVFPLFSVLAFLPAITLYLLLQRQFARVP